VGLGVLAVGIGMGLFSYILHFYIHVVVVIPSFHILLLLSVKWEMLRSGHPRLHLKQHKMRIPPWLPVNLKFFLLLSAPFTMIVGFGRQCMNSRLRRLQLPQEDDSGKSNRQRSSHDGPGQALVCQHHLVQG